MKIDMDQYFHGIDDVDVAFARLERVSPPSHLHATVMLALAARARRRRWIGYALLGGALLLAAALSFIVGQQLRLTGTLELARLMADNLDLVFDAPLDLLSALGEDVPWLLVGPVVASIATIAWSARLALTPIVQAQQRKQEG